MSVKHKIIRVLTSQIKTSGVTLPQIDRKNPTIQDINLSIHNGVINETNESDLRGEVKPKRKGRPKKQRT